MLHFWMSAMTTSVFPEGSGRYDGAALSTLFGHDTLFIFGEQGDRGRGSLRRDCVRVGVPGAGITGYVRPHGRRRRLDDGGDLGRALPAARLLDVGGDDGRDDAAQRAP